MSHFFDIVPKYTSKKWHVAIYNFCGTPFFSFLYIFRYIQCYFVIGATGFEPATSRPPAERATKLRHTPFCTFLIHYIKKIKKINL